MTRGSANDDCLAWSGLGFSFFVINLKRASRRREAMATQLNDRSVPHVFVDAIDGLDDSALQEQFTCDEAFNPQVNVPRPRPLSCTELACTLSHFRAIATASQTNCSWALICEDDIQLGDVNPAELSHVLSVAPANAAYIQLTLLGQHAVPALAQFHENTGALLAEKRNDIPTALTHPSLQGVGVHSAAAYLISSAGMANVLGRYTRDGRVVFPCAQSVLAHNVGLVADRFIYQAACNDHWRGYACCIPTFILEAQDSFLHPDHVPSHQAVRNDAVYWRSKLRGRLNTTTDLNP